MPSPASQAPGRPLTSPGSPWGDPSETNASFLSYNCRWPSPLEPFREKQHGHEARRLRVTKMQTGLSGLSPNPHLTFALSQSRATPRITLTVRKTQLESLVLSPPSPTRQSPPPPVTFPGKTSWFQIFPRAQECWLVSGNLSLWESVSQPTSSLPWEIAQQSQVR